MRVLKAIRRLVILKNIKKAYFYLRFRDGKSLPKRLLSGFIWYFKKGDTLNKLRNLLGAMEAFDTTSTESIESNCDDVLVIVPIYNSPLMSRECLEAIFTAEPKVQVLAVNDCSPDPEVVEMLEQLYLENSQRFRWIKTPENLGFPGAANLGIKERAGRHVLLVNSDVIVGEKFASKMKMGLRAKSKVASVTCLTNAGETASIPSLGENTDIPEKDFVEIFNSTLLNRGDMNDPNKWPVLPSGVGFCILLSSHAIEKVGIFDEKEFAPGYGEENDWSLRANKFGFLNLLCPIVFVYHIHGMTYGTSKRSLIDQHLAIVNKRYPRYEGSVRQFFAQDPLLYFRHALFFLGIGISSKIDCVLVIDHQKGGGATKVINNEFEASKNTLFIIASKFTADKVNFSFKFRNLSEIKYEGTIDELKRLISILNVKHIILNTLAFLADNEAKLAIDYVDEILQSSKTNIEFRLHDYHSVCPSLNLLNSKSQFCDIPDIKICNNCLPKNPHSIEIGVVEIQTWRDKWLNVLERSDRIICYGEESRNRLTSVYPSIAHKTDVRKHFVQPLSLPTPRSNRTPLIEELRIGIVGNLNIAKGSQVAIDLARTIKEKKNRSTLFSFGSIAHVPNNLPIAGMGPYSYPLDLYVKFKNCDLDVILMPSIWPETFNLVSEELDNLGLPVVLFALGAPYERHVDNEKFYFTEIIEGEKLLAFIQYAVKNYYENKSKGVRNH